MFRANPALGSPRRVLRRGEGDLTRRGCSDAHEYKRSSRIQKKLTNTEEAHEYKRSSRIQQKPQGASRSPKERAEAPTPSRSPQIVTRIVQIWPKFCNFSSLGSFLPIAKNHCCGRLPSFEVRTACASLTSGELASLPSHQTRSRLSRTGACSPD